MAAATKSKQLHVIVDNTQGIGAEVFGLLGAAKINVLATCCWEMGEIAHFLMIPSDVDAARKVLRKAGHKVTTEDVVTVTIPHKAGAFGTLLNKIKGAGVDAKLAYVTAATKTGAFVVLMTSADAKAVKAINK